VGILNEEVMKKNILTATLITLGLVAPTAVYAFTDADENLLITANRTQQDKFLALSAAKIISAEDIAVIQPQNITDLLSSVAGVSVSKQGGAGQSSSVFMRGTNSNHTLVLVDGVRVGSATLGTTNFAAMSVAQIERIEIVKGPRAALWGSDAFGGVIQIFTKQLTSGEGNITAGFGSNGLKKASASVGLGNTEHSITITVAGEKADGFNAYQTTASAYDINEPDEDGYDRLTFGAVGKSQVSDEITLTLASNWSEGGSEYDASYPDSPCWDDATKACPSFYANESEHENFHVNLGAQYNTERFIAELTLSKSQDQGDSFRNDAVIIPNALIQTKRDQLSILTQFTPSEDTSFTAGLDSYVEKVSGTTQTWSEEERDTNAVFLQVTHTVSDFLLEGAVRRDNIEGIGNETSYNLSAGYKISDAWLVSANKSTGFKAPTFNDLYWPGSGNAALKPEKIDNIELLVRGKGENSQLEISLFDSEVENLIAWAPNAQGAWQPSNVNNAEIKGVELTWALKGEHLSHQVALAYVKAEDANTGKALQRRPEITANYILGYHVDDFTINGIVSYRDESVDSSQIEPLDDYWLFDTSVTYQVSDNVSVIGKVNNVFDEEYDTAANYLSDGRNYQLSATYTF
jgi:vitamin B12 transporter